VEQGFGPTVSPEDLKRIVPLFARPAGERRTRQTG
jgi:hypothetical protein